MRTTGILTVAAGALLLPALVAGANLQFASSWASVPAKVDGATEAWSPLLRPLGDFPMIIGVQNDADYLYLCLKTSNPLLKRQIRSTGLTVWANGRGKANVGKGYGIRYPLEKVKHEGQYEDRRPTPTPTAEESVKPAPPPPSDLELIGPSEDDRRRIELADDVPVAAALGDDAGVMVLEFRIPLKISDPVPLTMGSTPGTPVALLLAAYPPREKPGKVWAENVGRHGMGRHRDEDAPEMPAPFTVWIQIALAPAPAAK